MKNYLAVLMVLVSTVAVAQEAQLTFVPPFPAAGEPVSLRIDSATGCYKASFGVASINLEARRVDLYVDIPDATFPGCEPQYVTPRTLLIGALPRGSYRVPIRTCGFVPPGEDPCSFWQQLALEVGGGDVVAVPTHSPRAAAALGFALLMFAAVHLRR